MTHALCPKCNSPLPMQAAAGICPKCLMAAGLQLDSQSFPSDPRHAEASAAESSAGDANPGNSRADVAERARRTRRAKQQPAFVAPSIADLATKFPHLEILELLGFGGMGAVYKVRQTKLDRLVALKLIRPEVSQDATFAARFNREAKTLAKLNHSNIVTVYDFGEVTLPAPWSDATTSMVSPPSDVSPLYYFLMEYVDGANVRQMLQCGKLTAPQALAIVPQICDALQYAHNEGVVHRDIKPENILVDKRGLVKIADFGLAKMATASDDDGSLTGTHQVMGTLRYMAPEQLESSHSVDHRADIYSLGVVFYEMLTGQIPAGHFEPPSRKVQVDVRLDEVVLRSMAREPERRYQHASELKTDVERVSASSHPGGTADFGGPTSTANSSSVTTPIASVQETIAEKERAAELAEIAPDWLQYPFIGLFCLGWIVVAVLWNLRWPGLLLATLNMAAITYCVIQWKLVYLPKLHSELARESRWQRIARCSSALLMFVLGTLCVIWFQTSLADAITASSMHDYYMIDPKTDLAAVGQAGFSDVTADNIRVRTSNFSMAYMAIPFSGVTAITLLVSAVATLIHTRRYRYTWKHFWAPSLSTTAWCFSTLLVVHFVHLVLVGYTSSSTPSRLFSVEGKAADTRSILSQWQAKHGFLVLVVREAAIIENDAEVGDLYAQAFVPASWFDRYHTSWRYPILRPTPTIRITVIGKHDSQHSHVLVEMPQHAKDSPEEVWWNAVVDDIQSQFRVVPAASVLPSSDILPAISSNDSITTFLNAAAAGHESKVRELLCGGMSVNDKDDKDRTALMEAAAHGHAALTILLIRLGADVNEQDNQGGTALMHAAEAGRSGVLQTLLDFRNSSSTGDGRTGITLNVDTRDNEGNTALSRAAAVGQTACVQLLMSPGLGADASLRNRAGRTALMRAAETNQVRLLTDLLAQPNTSLGTSVGNYTYNSFVDPQVVSRELPDGKNAIRLAEEAGHAELAALLRTEMLRAISHLTAAIERDARDVGSTETEAAPVYTKVLASARQALGELTGPPLEPTTDIVR